MRKRRNTLLWVYIVLTAALINCPYKASAMACREVLGSAISNSETSVLSIEKRLEDQVESANERYFKFSQDEWIIADEYFAKFSSFYRGFSSPNYTGLNLFRYLLGDSKYEQRSWDLTRSIERLKQSGMSDLEATQRAKFEIGSQIIEEINSKGTADYLVKESYSNHSRIALERRTGKSVWFTPFVAYAKVYSERTSGDFSVIFNARPNPKRFMPYVTHEVLAVSHLPPSEVQGAYFSRMQTEIAESKWYYAAVESNKTSHERTLVIYEARFNSQSNEFILGDRLGSVQQNGSGLVVDNASLRNVLGDMPGLDFLTP